LSIFSGFAGISVAQLLLVAGIALFASLSPKFPLKISASF
jgi:hypothetical protein